MDHDRLFKELLTTFFLDFLEVFCPELAKYLDQGSLEFLDKEVFTFRTWPCCRSGIGLCN